MSVTFWVLAMAVLILVYVFGGIIVFYIRRIRKRGRLAKRNAPEDAAVVLEIPEDMPESERPRHIVVKDLLQKKYDSVNKALKIPPDAALTIRRVDVFCLPDCDIMHYCWADSSNIYFFPQWESIEAGLDAGGIRNYCQGDENTLHMLRLPESSVDYWRGRQDGMVQLTFSSKFGEKADLLLDSEVAPVFAGFIPEKELGYVIKHVYPRSSQNISDIRKEFSRINNSWKKGRITDEEYNNGKLKILITM